MFHALVGSAIPRGACRRFRDGKTLDANRLAVSIVVFIFSPGLARKAPQAEFPVETSEGCCHIFLCHHKRDGALRRALCDRGDIHVLPPERCERAADNSGNRPQVLADDRNHRHGRIEADVFRSVRAPVHGQTRGAAPPPCCWQARREGPGTVRSAKKLEKSAAHRLEPPPSSGMCGREHPAPRPEPDRRS